jgi:hypothetical protein
MKARTNTIITPIKAYKPKTIKITSCGYLKNKKRIIAIK